MLIPVITITCLFMICYSIVTLGMFGKELPPEKYLIVYIFKYCVYNYKRPFIVSFNFIRKLFKPTCGYNHFNINKDARLTMTFIAKAFAVDDWWWPTPEKSLTRCSLEPSDSSKSTYTIYFRISTAEVSVRLELERLATFNISDPDFEKKVKKWREETGFDNRIR